MTKHAPGKLLEGLILIICRDPSYGYKIVKEIESMSGGFWNISYGTVYPLIDKMVDKNLLEKADLEGKDSRRNYFKTTEKGISKLEDEELKEKGIEKFRELIIGYLNIYQSITDRNIEEIFMEVEDAS